MTQQYTPNLGYTPADDARRDACHIAAAPVIAAEPLVAGWTVALDSSGEAYANPSDGIGIVDPFRSERIIRKGERFWLLLFPGTITGLRHVWAHPAFQAKPPIAKEQS